MLTSLIDNTKIIYAAGALFAPLLCAVLLKLFSGKLPKDQGREFAVDGKKSAGKIRGAGIIFVIAFVISSLLFVKISLEYIIYYALMFIEMLSGYLDDRSEKPWGEYKKAVIDLLVSAGASATFVYFNKSLLNISFFGFGIHVHPVIYIILGAALVWLLINAVNCSDGIDGFSSILAILSFSGAAAAIIINKGDMNQPLLAAIMILTLLPYIWFNSEPSSMMMGDAGSRALGFFLAIMIMKTGNALLVIPLCFMVCLDGLLGIVKVSVIRFLHIKFMMKIRTPLHDHCRKNLGWSNSQVRYRFAIIQMIITVFALIILK
ncbi:MAG: phospho-N-acetylmuramoyl-pentapeptide-transferase [Clostridia bacterium]|nr:phospho-N-acetylmuramoyl-pentapeptide-transferase [Clostridia bacterium]